jgi:hypothetical protein
MQLETLHSLTQDLAHGIAEARRLRAVADDDSTPYASRYAAAVLLRDLEDKAAAHLTCHGAPRITGGDVDAGGSGSSDECAAALSTALARCQIERGLALVDTDLTAEAGTALEQGLCHIRTDAAPALVLQLEAHNALAALAYSRGNATEALHHLQAAIDVHASLGRAKADNDSSGSNSSSSSDGGRAGGSNSSSGDGGASVDSDDESTDGTAKPEIEAGSGGSSSSGGTATCDGLMAAALAHVGNAEAEHTSSLYYLAQAHGLAGDKAASAVYCAATLNRQLAAGAPGSVNQDW